MLAEINLTAMVTIENNLVDKKELEKIILVKVPTEIYPTLYETFVYLFSQAGIKNININKPWFISGGINLNNISEILNNLIPYGIDISSGVEDHPGIKNSKKIIEIMKKING